MNNNTINFEKYWYLITPSKLFYQICDEYSVSQKVLRRKIEKAEVKLLGGVLMPIDQYNIYEAFGPPYPPPLNYKKFNMNFLLGTLGNIVAL